MKRLSHKTGAALLALATLSGTAALADGQPASATPARITSISVDSFTEDVMLGWPEQSGEGVADVIYAKTDLKADVDWTPILYAQEDATRMVSDGTNYVIVVPTEKHRTSDGAFWRFFTRLTMPVGDVPAELLPPDNPPVLGGTYIRLNVADQITIRRGSQTSITVLTDYRGDLIEAIGFNSTIISVTHGKASTVFVAKGLKSGTTTLTFRLPSIDGDFLMKTIAVVVTN